MHNFKVGDRVVKKYPTSEKLWHGTVMGLGSVERDPYSYERGQEYRLAPNDTFVVVKWDDYTYPGGFDMSRGQGHTVSASTLKLDQTRENTYTYFKTGDGYGYHIKNLFVVENYGGVNQPCRCQTLYSDGTCSGWYTKTGFGGFCLPKAKATEILNWCEKHNRRGLTKYCAEKGINFFSAINGLYIVTNLSKEGLGNFKVLGISGYDTTWLTGAGFGTKFKAVTTDEAIKWAEKYNRPDILEFFVQIDALTLDLPQKSNTYDFFYPSVHINSIFVVRDIDDEGMGRYKVVRKDKTKDTGWLGVGAGFGTTFQRATKNEVLWWATKYKRRDILKYLRTRPLKPEKHGLKRGTHSKTHQEPHERARTMNPDYISVSPSNTQTPKDPWQLGGYLYTLDGTFEGIVLKKERYGNTHMFALRHPSGDIKTFFTDELYDATDKELIELEETQRLTRYEKIKSWAKGFFQACAITGILATAVGIGANSELIQDFVVMVMDHANLTQVNHENF